MMDKEKYNSIIFRIRVFIWYIFTEPLRQFYAIYKMVVKTILLLNKTLTWVYISMVFVIGYLYLGDRKTASIFLFFLLFCILLWEWQSGNFMYRYRKIQRKKLMEAKKK